ncbi:MAG: hypothetical protein E6J90_24650 [Deltaproteobacteria bacterium]|nr:MAG: hypothetical protein E6J90_24650 [Deltaproteobacteria bacterium]TMQ17777.1 MAG: hypothetical protein E6J91_09340 [Deltaproteobacteria bacterium]
MPAARIATAASRTRAAAWSIGWIGLAAACGGPATPVAPSAPPPATVAERMLAMLPQGAQIVVEIDLARLRGNPVIGAVVTRALADREGELAGVPAPPLAVADQVVLAAYGVGTAQAATLTLLAAPHDIAGATRLADGFYAVGPPEWVAEAEQRVALAGAGSAAALRAAPELLALRGHAMPAGAPGAALQVTARLPFDARISLARETGVDPAPAQLSAWADVADDLALVVDCDAADPGDARSARRGDGARRLEAALRGVLAALAEQPAIRVLGLPASLAGARLIARGTWVRTIIAIGPAHLRRVVERADRLLGAPAPGARPQPPVPTPQRGEPS